MGITYQKIKKIEHLEIGAALNGLIAVSSDVQ